MNDIIDVIGVIVLYALFVVGFFVFIYTINYAGEKLAQEKAQQKECVIIYQPTKPEGV